MCSCNIKIFNLLDYKKYNILIVGSRNIGPAVAGPVPTPLLKCNYIQNKTIWTILNSYTWVDHYAIVSLVSLFYTRTHTRTYMHM